jgi:hypothetical protein
MELFQTVMVEHTPMGFLLRSEFFLYKLANYATVNLIDDAAMLALIFS